MISTIEQNKEMKDQTIEISFTLSNIKATLAGIIPFKFIVNGYEYK